MPVLRELQNDIIKALNVAALTVYPWSQTDSNMVVLLRDQEDGEAYFAKVFLRDTPDGLSANERYRREKTILSAMQGLGAPELMYSEDVARVLVTRGADGHGVKHFIDSGDAKTAIGAIAQWLARFHNRFETHAPAYATLADHLALYPGYSNLNGFDDVQAKARSIPLTELVLSRGDGSASNFRFTEDRVVGFDFEAAAFRAKEIDMIGIAQDFAMFTDETPHQIADWVVAHYALVRPVEDIDATIELIALMLTLLTPAAEAA